eukprot:symbB.v1.2.009207.t1/scaffold580.1/size320225/9
MSKTSWNSDCLDEKRKIRRQPKSNDSSDGSATHESFPVHGLVDERDYQRRASGLLRGDVEDGESVCTFCSSESDIHESNKAGLQKTVEALQCKDIKGGKLVLRPYGVGSQAVMKAELLKRALSNEEEDGKSVVVGEQVVDLNFVCPEIQESEVGEEFPTVLHQEDTIDVRVVKLGQFGEAAILKSLADVNGVVPVIGWSHCLQTGFPEREQLRSLYFPYIKGNISPTDPVEIQDYMHQLLAVLDELHRREIVHCNIKRENVLYASAKLTLIDFESAVILCEKSNPFHSAPEVLEAQRGRSKHGRKVLYGHRRDVYGAGIILGELLLRLDPQERLLNHLHFPGGRRNRKEMRREFSLRLNGGKGPNNQGSMRDAFGGLQHYGQLDFTKLNKHGADLVKHMMLWDRFKRPRAWEALQHSFFHVDPKDTQIEPPFATLLQKPVHEVPLPEEDTFDFRDDDHPIPKNIHQISFIPEERRELADCGDIMLKERFCLRNRISGKWRLVSRKKDVPQNAIG